MRKAILAGAIGLIAGAGFVVPQFANAAAPVPYNGDDCTGAIGAPPTAGVLIGTGQVGVCVDGAGWLGVGVAAPVVNPNGPNRVCNGAAGTQTNTPVGIYVIADGDSANPDPADGYAGISNYESGSSNEDCNQSNNGNGSNSGGSSGLDGQPGTQVPLPFACGNTSGRTFGSTGRDGCYNP
jgi:hypothetical protein